MGVAAAARIIYWLAATPDYEAGSDAGQYVEIAYHISQGNGFQSVYPELDPHATAFRPPLFPGVLGLVYWILWPAIGLARALNLVLGLATVVVTARLGTEIGGQRVGLTASSVVALYPPLIVNDVSALSETLSLLLMAVTLLALLRERHLEAGVLAGLLVLTRASAQGLVLVLAIWVLWRLGWRRAIAFGAVAGLVVAPWVVRNWVVMDEPTLVTSNGFNVAAVYSPAAEEAGEWIDPTYDPAFNDLRFLQFDEVAWTSEIGKQGLVNVRADPLQVIDVVRRNLPLYFEFDPDENEIAERLDGRNLQVRDRTLPFFYIVTSAAVVGVCIDRHRRGVGLVTMVAAYFMATSLVLISVPRLRAPFDLVCALGAGLLVAHVAEAVTARRQLLGAGPRRSNSRSTSS